MLAGIMLADADDPAAPFADGVAVLDRLQLGDFHGHLERQVYRALKDHADKGLVLDPFSIGDTLKARGVREDDFGPIWKTASNLRNADRALNVLLVERFRRGLRQDAEGLEQAARALDPVLAAEPVLERLRTAPDAASQSERSGRRALLVWPNLGELLAAPPPPREWLFDGCFPCRSVSALVGPGASGKSILAFQLCSALATGSTFGPFRPDRPRKILYVAGEDDGATLHERLYHLSREMRLDHKLLRANLAPLSLVGFDRVLLALDRGGNPNFTPTFDWLMQSLESLGPIDALVLDPLVRFHSVNENDNGAMAQVIAACDTIVSRCSCAVAFVHHESRQGRAGALRDSFGRGASSLRDGVRFMLSCAELAERKARDLGVNPRDLMSVLVTKSNYGAGWQGERHFRRGDHGILAPVDLRSNLIRDHADALVELVERDGPTPRREIMRGWRKRLSEEYPGITKHEFLCALDHALADGRLLERRDKRGDFGTHATVIAPPTRSAA